MGALRDLRDRLEQLVGRRKDVPAFDAMCATVADGAAVVTAGPARHVGVQQALPRVARRRAPHVAAARDRDAWRPARRRDLPHAGVVRNDEARAVHEGSESANCRATDQLYGTGSHTLRHATNERRLGVCSGDDDAEAAGRKRVRNDCEALRIPASRLELRTGVNGNVAAARQIA